MILYVEQPFPYDLEAHRIDVHSVSARKPLFMDESAHDWRFVRLGRELGWTGVALKTCKTQTGALLTLCWAKAHGMTLMVQDLSNPMLAQIPHVLLAAHAGTIMGVESNGMQFYPEASLPEAAVHPGLYRRRGGRLDLSTDPRAGLWLSGRRDRAQLAGCRVFPGLLTNGTPPSLPLRRLECMNNIDDYESKFWDILKREHLVDFSQFHKSGFFDEVPLFSRDSDLEFLAKLAGDQANAILLNFALKFFKSVVSYEEHRRAFFAAITVRPYSGFVPLSKFRKRISIVQNDGMDQGSIGPLALWRT